MTALIQKHGRGDWRPVLTAAIAIERAINASTLNECSLELVKDVTQAFLRRAWRAGCGTGCPGGRGALRSGI